MRVVKLGGSLFDAPELRLWLNALAEHGAGQGVVVPGGGPFADGVRSAQRQRHFSDEAAHRMALLGMGQYGLMLADMESRLIGVRGRDQIPVVLDARKVAVWLPDPLQLDNALQASWDCTSDSVAAWLAKQVDATALLLVKSTPLPTGVAFFDCLQTREIVDRSFPGACRDGAFSVWLAGRSGYAQFGAWLDGAPAYLPVVVE